MNTSTFGVNPAYVSETLQKLKSKLMYKKKNPLLSYKRSKRLNNNKKNL